MALSSLFRPVEFADIPGWYRDRMAAAFEAFQRSARHALVKPYKTGSLGVEAGAFIPAYEAAVASGWTTMPRPHSSNAGSSPVHFDPKTPIAVS